MSDFGRNFLPGPTDVHPEVLAAQLTPMFSHRSKRMQEILAAMQPSLQECFGTAQPVFLSTSSATGLIEGAVRSGVRQRVLVATGGYFGEYFAKTAEHCGKQALRIPVEPGRAITAEQLAAALDTHKVDAVAVVHSESSTGALADIPALAKVVRAKSDVLFLVDGVTSVGAMPILMDAWGVDFYCTGSQKAMALPPGLGLGAASERFVARASQQRDAGFYLSIARMVSIARQNLPIWTPAVSLIMALECQLARIARDGGWPIRWARHRAMLGTVERWITARGDVKLLAPEGARSPAISSVLLPDGADPAGLIRTLEERGYLVGGALDPSHGPLFRIGHMGDLTPAHLEGLLAVVSELLG
ncbi:MAG: alanine--glyoxylate aminotransferase family protein [Gemmatimonadales bacterium]|nr:alanine--glyoxylate aminotransferase family protein [Gemmatimonadales bacterium]